MDRSKLAALASVGGAILIGATTWIIYTPNAGVVAAQLTDAGVDPTHVVTCPVRLSPDALAYALDAGFSVHQYERLRVAIHLESDAGLKEAVLPPNLPSSTFLGQQWVQVLDWRDCILETCAARPAVCARWGGPLPFGLGARRKCVRANIDAGLPCLRSGNWDGGSFGDFNVFQRSEAVNPATCESVECVVMFGDGEGGL